MSRAVLPAHGKDAHRCNGPDPIPVLIHLAIADTATTRRFVVTDDLGGTYIRSIHATLGVPGSSATTIDADNETNTDDLSNPNTVIDSGETSSYTAATPHVMTQTGTPPNNYVTRGDVLLFTITRGTGALELTVLIEFGPQLVRITP